MSEGNRRAEIVHAYDEALNLLLHLEEALDLAVGRFRRELVEARRKALKNCSSRREEE